MTKNVALHPYLSRISSTCCVNSEGPSSKVKYTTLRPLSLSFQSVLLGSTAKSVSRHDKSVSDCAETPAPDDAPDVWVASPDEEATEASVARPALELDALSLDCEESPAPATVEDAESAVALSEDATEEDATVAAWLPESAPELEPRDNMRKATTAMTHTETAMTMPETM